LIFTWFAIGIEWGCVGSFADGHYYCYFGFSFHYMLYFCFFWFTSQVAF